MSKRFLARATTLMAPPGLALTGLLFLFLLLSQGTAHATPGRAGLLSDALALNSTFAVSGTVTCQATGPISDVEVVLWDSVKSSVVASDTTDINGTYGVMLDEGTYYLEYLTPAAAGLNAEAHTALELITDTVLDVDFCVCSGIWVSETVDSAGDVGSWTSLALAPTYPYTPHISYRDVTGDSLKHAWLSGTTWFSDVVDAGCWRTSLALVPTYPYTPCIGYDGCQNDIKFAWLEGTTWNSDTVPAGTYAGDSSLALEPTYPYAPHISYFYDLGNFKSLYHAYLSGTTWLSGTWEREPVEPPGSKAGRSSSLALESTYPYTPHISYRFRIGDSDLRHAWLNGTTWLTETVDSAGDVGKNTSLALGSSGNPHISYFDDTNNALKYAWLSGTTWFSRTVDSVGEPPYGIGRSSLGLDQSDLPYISYYDAADGDLKFAQLNGTVWIIQTVDSGGDVGQFNSLALDQVGCPHISYYDATNGDLKYAYISPADTTGPEIEAAAPVSGAVDVAVSEPVVITFSEPIAAGTFTYTVTPDPGGWSASWDGAGTAVTLPHNPFAHWTTYAFTVTAADDPAGNHLAGAPYAWRFTTVPYRVYLPLVMRNYIP